MIGTMRTAQHFNILNDRQWKEDTFKTKKKWCSGKIYGNIKTKKSNTISNTLEQLKNSENNNKEMCEAFSKSLQQLKSKENQDEN